MASAKVFWLPEKCLMLKEKKQAPEMTLQSPPKKVTIHFQMLAESW